MFHTVFQVPQIYFTQHLKFYSEVSEELYVRQNDGIEGEIDRTLSDLTKWFEETTI